MIAFLVAGFFSLFMKNILAFILYNSAFLYFYFFDKEEKDEDEKEELSFSDILLFPSLKENNMSAIESTQDEKNINIKAIAVFVFMTSLLSYTYSSYSFLFLITLLPLFFVIKEK